MFNSFIKIGLLYIILSFLHPYLACSYFQCLKLEDESKSQPNISKVSFKNENENHHLSQDVCSPKQFFKITINPYRDIVKWTTPSNIFKSACLQCAACLAIAQQIDESMQEIQIGSLDPKEEAEKIENALKFVCTNGFKEFDLRNYKGHTILMKASWSTSHVSTNMNGRWQSKLREICSRYLEHINVPTFYAILLKKSYGIENYMCRGDGVFRDCSNINLKENPVIEEDCHPEIPDIRFVVKCIT